jgi:hypothetical protein
MRAFLPAMTAPHELIAGVSRTYPMANSPKLNPGIARFMDVCDLELLNIDFVFAYQFPKSASLFLRCTGSLGNISLVSEQ